jgi:hypothetical protein
MKKREALTISELLKWDLAATAEYMDIDYRTRTIIYLNFYEPISCCG